MTTEDISDEIFDLLVDNVDKFLTIGSIAEKLKEINPTFKLFDGAQNCIFINQIKKGCDKLIKKYKMVYKFYIHNNSYYTVYIFSNKDYDKLVEMLEQCNLENECNYDNYYDTMDYLDYIASNKNKYNFNPNNKIYNDLSPLELLAISKDKSSADIASKLIINYDDISVNDVINTINNSTEPTITNLKILNLCYEKQLKQLNDTVRTLQEKISCLENEKKNYELSTSSFIFIKIISIILTIMFILLCAII